MHYRNTASAINQCRIVTLYCPQSLICYGIFANVHNVNASILIYNATHIARSFMFKVIWNKHIKMYEFNI